MQKLFQKHRHSLRQLLFVTQFVILVYIIFSVYVQPQSGVDDSQTPIIVMLYLSIGLAITAGYTDSAIISKQENETSQLNEQIGQLTKNDEPYPHLLSEECARNISAAKTLNFINTICTIAGLVISLLTLELAILPILGLTISLISAGILVAQMPQFKIKIDYQIVRMRNWINSKIKIHTDSQKDSGHQSKADEPIADAPQAIAISSEIERETDFESRPNQVP